MERREDSLKKLLKNNEKNFNHPSHFLRENF